jgi:hypothetical protein
MDSIDNLILGKLTSLSEQNAKASLEQAYIKGLTAALYCLDSNSHDWLESWRAVRRLLKEARQGEAVPIPDSSSPITSSLAA